MKTLKQVLKEAEKDNFVATGRMPDPNPERDRLFDELAQMQRGAPENAMLRIQKSGISQIYDHIAEHVGDLIHRMSEKRTSSAGYEFVKQKVDKALYFLTNPYGFEKEALEQIHSNLAVWKEQGKWMDETFDSLYKKIRDLSKKYAEEHRKLPTYNDAQKHAQAAAVSLGEWDFDQTTRHLKELDKHLKKGREHWEQYALEFGGSQKNV